MFPMPQLTQPMTFSTEQQPTLESGLPAQITNQLIAQVLFNIATLLEMQQGNPYRIAAYRNAARGLMGLPVSAAAIIKRGERLVLPGLGERLRRKITEMVTTGRMTFYLDLCAELLPEEARSLMTVAHVGPRTALRLSNYLGIQSVAQLYEAAHAHKLREYYGFGPRSEQRLEDATRALLQPLPTPPAQPPQAEPPRPQAA